MATVERKEVGGKKIRAARKQIDASKLYNVAEAVKLLQGVTSSNFDQTLEIVAKLGVDPRHSDQMVRGVVAMPAGTGKNVRVAVICKDEKKEEALKAGADMAGSAEIIEEIKAGTIAFDVCIATPDMMGSVGQVARILGPKGLMPNPKLGTVTPDIASAISNAKSGQVEYRVEKAGIVHAGVGKLSFTTEDLVKNVDALFAALMKAKPSGLKGTYMKAAFISSTMGPSVKLDLATLTQ